MAFFISKSDQQALAAEYSNNYRDHEKVITGRLGSPSDPSQVTTEVHLISSARASSDHSMDKEAVLRRIRHHKYLNRVRGAIQAAFQDGSRPDRRFREDPEDAFSSP
ncbi:hypothetical protein CDL15_Pgr004762 [Punica granatum]|uniref:Uncharacterized protein n=1 Tax=Punica granatum TaxID=22663 RepID=A0A218W7I1_PUNGR|nr:hypothetical protein CDL15_Pgr004762 [Punica granatum]PKI36186.1 hypothetical protein CRG98_043424 [Punica granatum]